MWISEELPATVLGDCSKGLAEDFDPWLGFLSKPGLVLGGLGCVLVIGSGSRACGWHGRNNQDSLTQTPGRI